jgi:putative salt-induced outer membrane protein YdiY
LTVAALLMQACWLQPAAAADEPPPEAPQKPWNAEVGVGILLTSGNTENKNLNGTANLGYEVKQWRETARLEVTRNRSDGVDTAERYFAQSKTDYKFDPDNYAFLLLNYEDDRFSGYDYQATESIGYGRSVLKGPSVKLDLETGVGSRQSKPIDTDETQSEGFIHLAGIFDWTISEQATFREELSSDIGEDLTVTSSLTALTTQIVGNLAAKLAVRVRNISEVPPGIEKTDTETTVNLVYKF